MEPRKKIWLIAILLVLWYPIYLNLDTAASFIVYNIIGLTPGDHLTESIKFFVYEVPKVFLLLALIVFIMGIVRSYFSPEKTRALLGGKNHIFGNISAASLGIVTPFCSCSAIPLFLGFVESGVPLGVTFSFLIAAPMINEIALILLLELFGWQTALIYMFAGLFIAIFSGWIIGKLKLEHWVEDWVYQMQATNTEFDEKLTFFDRIDRGVEALRDIIAKVWLYIVVGIAVGAGAHGYIPENFMASLMGSDKWYSVPLSILIGVPLYSNAAGIIPVVKVLLEKGASLGTALAFMMSVIGLSLPETIILKKVLKLPLIITFIGIVSLGIMLVGFVFNFIY